MIVREMPYSNLHDLNIDWILKIIKDFHEKYQNLDETFQEMLRQIDEKGNEAIEAITQNKDTALNAMQNFLEQCVQALDQKTLQLIRDLEAEKTADIEEIQRVTNNQLIAINGAGENQRTLIGQEGTRQINTLQAIINTIPQTYEDAVNQLQIINSILNMNYTYPSLVQGVYGAGTPTTDLTQTNYVVSTLLSSGCAQRTLEIEITNGTALINKVYWWEGWGENITMHTIDVSVAGQSVTHYTITFPSNATYYSISFSYDLTLETQLLITDFDVSLIWHSQLVDYVNTFGDSIINTQKALDEQTTFFYKVIESVTGELFYPEYVNRTTNAQTGELGGVDNRRASTEDLYYMPIACVLYVEVDTTLFRVRAHCFNENNEYIGYKDVSGTGILPLYDGTRYIRYLVSHADNSDITIQEAEDNVAYKVIYDGRFVKENEEIKKLINDEVIFTNAIKESETGLDYELTYSNVNIDSTTGEVTGAHTRRASTVPYYYYPPYCTLSITFEPSIYRARAFCYDKNKQYVGYISPAQSGEMTMHPGTEYLRFLVSRQDDAVITPEEAASAATYNIKYTGRFSKEEYKKYLRLSVIGDSYTAYPGWIPPNQNVYYPNSSETVKSFTQMWWYLVCKEMNWEPLIIDGYSGSTVCTHTREPQPASAAFVNRIKNTMGEHRTLDPKPDVIIILGGQNDFYGNVDVGELQYSDWTDEDLYKFTNAFCYMLDYLQKYNPGAKIVNLTNLNFVSPRMVVNMAEACEHYGIQNLLLYNVERDSAHPTANGMQQICNIIKNEIIL